MSLIHSSIFCRNAKCQNELTSFEIQRRNDKRISKYWYCALCRRKRQIDNLLVICPKCEREFPDINLAKYCDDCTRRVRGRGMP